MAAYSNRFTCIVSRQLSWRGWQIFPNFSRALSIRQNNGQNYTHFGFEQVSEETKGKKVHEIFTNVACHYDVMNDAMSCGIHRLWKDHLIDVLGPQPGTKLLDVAGGTGDIAFRFLHAIQNLEKSAKDATEGEDDILNPLDQTTEVEKKHLQIMSRGDHSEQEKIEIQDNHAHVVICDINKGMLDIGKRKAQEAKLTSGISWVHGDGENMPFPDNAFDAYTVAFGLRNFVHIDKALEEALRVLKPGGRFLCLEFSQVDNPLVSRLYDLYSFQVIPVMGQVIAKDWKSYQYLVESIRQFPNQEEFKTMVEDSGFQMVTYENLLCGIAAIHSGFKL